jgi:hypothetical protein
MQHEWGKNECILGYWWEVDNIKMYLRKIGWDGVDLIDMAQDRDQ